MPGVKTCRLSEKTNYSLNQSNLIDDMKIIEKNLFRNGFNADSALTRSPSWTRLAQEQAERARRKQENKRKRERRKNKKGKQEKN